MTKLATEERVAHTPAPWEVKAVFICQKDSESLHFGEYQLNLWGIAGRTTPPNTSPTLSRAEANANARVMEAAPELLQALKLIHDWWSEDDSSDPVLRPGALLGDEDDDRAAIGNIVSAAIAKAEGKQR